MNVTHSGAHAGTPEGHNTSGTAPQSTPPPMHTKPPLWRRLAIFLRPLTREGRETMPGWYLSAPRWKIAKAPPGSPLGECISRSVEGWAIALWWPIARVLTVAFLWREGLVPRTTIEWWKAIASDRRRRGSAPVPMSSGEPCAVPAAVREDANDEGARKTCGEPGTGGTEGNAQ